MRQVAALAVLSLTAAYARPSKPKSAFPEQTLAKPPAKPSEPLKVETIAAGLTGAWAMAFLPDGKFLVTENSGEMRIVQSNGFVSAPLTGVPPVKLGGTHGLHDFLLDPGFAENRTLFFTYFAPPKGEAPGNWPNKHFYEDVLTKPLAERRTPNIGSERIARARLSKDNRRLEDVEVLAEGAERRIVLAPDGTFFVTGDDRFGLYDSELDGVTDRSPRTIPG